MKKLDTKTAFCLVLPIFIFIGWASAQPVGKTSRISEVPVTKKTGGPLKTEAEKAWRPFWEKFKTAIMNRDAKALVEFMSEDFKFHLREEDCSYYSADNYDSNRNNRFQSQMREFAIKKFSDSKCRYGWNEIDKIISHGRAKTMTASKTNEYMDETAGTLIRYLSSSGNYKYGIQSYEHMIRFRFANKHWLFVEFRWVEPTT